MDESGFSTSLHSLTTTSRMLSVLAARQSARERNIQELCNSVWTVVQQQYSVSGKCGSEQQYTVSHQYTQQVAVVDAAKLDALRAEMSEHLAFATSELASALYEHALAEQDLLAFAQKHLAQAESRPSAPTAHRLLRLAVDALASSAAAPTAATGSSAPLTASSVARLGADTSVGLDSRTLPALRNLALALGGVSLAASREGGAANSDGPLPDGDALLSIVYYGMGCGWAAPLVQPTPDDLVGGRWL